MADHEGLVCYCFLHSHDEIVSEVLSTGKSTALTSIRTNMETNGCACEVQNPTGKCCLRDVQRIVEQAIALEKGVTS